MAVCPHRTRSFTTPERCFDDTCDVDVGVGEVPGLSVHSVREDGVQVRPVVSGDTRPHRAATTRARKFDNASARVEAPSFFAARCINTRTVESDRPSS